MSRNYVTRCQKLGWALTRNSYAQLSMEHVFVKRLMSRDHHVSGRKSNADFIVRSCLSNIDPVISDPLPDFVWQNLGSYESLPAFTCGATGRSFSHKDVYKYSRSFATSLLQSRGIKRNDVIAIMLPNVPEFSVAFMGILSAGMIASPINHTFTESEIASQLSNCRAKAIITVLDLVPMLLSIKSVCPSLESIIVASTEAPPGTHSLYQMMKTNADTNALKNKSRFDGREEIACIPYSSGTTGSPKGVVLSHSNLATNMVQQSHPSITPIRCYTDGREQERIVGILPFHHIYGLNVISTITLYRGSHCVTIPKFDPKVFLQTLREHKPTVLHLVPPLINFMVHSKQVGEKEMEGLRIIIAGGAPAGSTLISNILEKAGKFICFQEGYGMTELSPVSHLTPPFSENKKIGSIGQNVPSTMSKIIDVNTGECVRSYARGELCVKGPQVMQGYYENEAATKETLSSDGWLRTGDVGYYDEDGFFYVVDRIKELIKVKGSQVSPSELEDVLRKLPGVLDCAIIGIPSKSSGELPRAYIVKDNPNLSAEDVHSYLKPLVSNHKQLHGGIEFVEAIPKAPSGKILRKDLKVRYFKNGGNRRN